MDATSITLAVTLALSALGHLFTWLTKRTEAEAKATEDKQLAQRISALEATLKIKNAYIRELEGAALQSATPDQLARILNGLYKDGGGREAHSLPLVPDAPVPKT